MKEECDLFENSAQPLCEVPGDENGNQIMLRCLLKHSKQSAFCKAYTVHKY